MRPRLGLIALASLATAFSGEPNCPSTLQVDDLTDVDSSVLLQATLQDGVVSLQSTPVTTHVALLADAANATASNSPHITDEEEEEEEEGPQGGAETPDDEDEWLEARPLDARGAEWAQSGGAHGDDSAPIIAKPRVAVAGLRRNPPMPRTMKAICCLMIQYFLVHAGLAVAKSSNKLAGAPPGPAERAFETVVKTVNLTPMLCTLFLAPWSQAMRLAGSLDPSPLGLPGAHVEGVMVVCTATLIIKTVLHLFVLLQREACSEDKLSISPSEVSAEQTRFAFDRCANIVVCLILYTSVSLVVYATVFMPPAEEIEAQGRPSGMNTATYCTLLLAVQYFVVSFVSQALTPIDAGKEGADWLPPLLNRMSNTVGLAPMLCLLFQSARMHAIELSPPSGEPPLQVRRLMLLSGHAHFLVVLLHLTSVPFGPRQAHATPRGTPHGRQRECSEHFGALSFIGSLRVALMIVIYGAAGLVCAAVWSDPTLTKVKGKDSPEEGDIGDADPPTVSGTVVCVVLVATLYLGVHLVIRVTTYARYIFMAASQAAKHVAAVARDAVGLSPMVSALFVCIRLRSLQLTEGLGGPQLWMGPLMRATLVGLIVRLAASVARTTIELHASRAAGKRALQGIPEDAVLKEVNAKAPPTTDCRQVFLTILAVAELKATMLVYLSCLCMALGNFRMTQENTQEFEQGWLGKWVWQ